MYLITYHSYGRQGSNNSAPLLITDTIEKAREYILGEINKGSKLESYKFQLSTETKESMIKPVNLIELESYASNPNDHWNYDYEEPLFTIWEWCPKNDAIGTFSSSPKKDHRCI